MRIPTIERKDDGPPDTADESRPAASAPSVASASPPASDVPPSSLERMVAVEAPLAGLVTKGTLLSILTLGIYRFWYRTALRRFYWSNTRLAGDGFEYTGTGRELFVGFLIALAIVLPLYFVVTLLGLFGGEVVGPIVATILAAVVMPAVVQILVYRARRYRLARTRYRGIRLHQTGTGTAYLLRTVKWLLLTALTLGILFPYFRRALERYKIENTWYGSAQGEFDAPAKPLMKPWLALWGTVVGSSALGVVVPFVFVAGYTAMGSVLSVLLSLTGPALFVIWVHYKVTEFKTFLAGTRFQGITLSSDLRTRSVLWIYVRLGLLLVAAVFIAGIVAFLFKPLLPSLADEESIKALFDSPAGVVVALLTGVATLLIFALIIEILFRRRLWALRASSIDVANLAVLDQIVQKAGQDATGIGEAFDTGFDIAG